MINYDEYEIPESIPLAWEVLFSTNTSTAFEYDRGSIPILTDEGKEWFDLYITGEYSFKYSIYDRSVESIKTSLSGGLVFTPRRLIQVYFTNENDFLMFKMRWT